MVKIPKKAKVIVDRSITMSDGSESPSLKDKIVEVYLTPKGENIWTCRFEGKEFMINREFLEVVEFEELGCQR